VTAASRRRQARPQKKQINPLIILGPIGVVLIVLVVILVSQGGDGGSSATGDGSGSSTASTSTDETPQTAASDEEEQKRREQEQEIARLKQAQEFRNRSEQCKTANDFVTLAREAKRVDLDEVAEDFFSKALLLEPDNVRARSGLNYVKFDCARHLKQYDMISFGGLDDEIAEFAALDEEWIAPQRFDIIVKEWEEKLPKMIERVELLEGDIFEQKLQAYTKQLKTFPFFNEIARAEAYSIQRGGKPVALFIQDARDRQEGHADEVGRAYVPMLEALKVQFEEGFLQKHGFVKKETGFNAYIVWILNSGGAYSDYCRDRDKQPELSTNSRAHYNFMRKEAITYLEGGGHGWRFDDMQPLAHEMVHYFQDAYAPYGIRGMSSHWVVEGMAEWISTFTGKVPEGPYYFMSRNGGRIRDFLRINDMLDGRWPIRLDTILDIYNGPNLHTMIAGLISEDEEIAALGHKDNVAGMLVSWFYAASYCMCRYLYAEDDEAFIDFLKLDFEGDGGRDEFLDAFGVDDLDQLEQDISDFVKPEGSGGDEE